MSAPVGLLYVLLRSRLVDPEEAVEIVLGRRRGQPAAALVAGAGGCRPAAGGPCSPAAAKHTARSGSCSSETHCRGRRSREPGARSKQRGHALARQRRARRPSPERPRTQRRGQRAGERAAAGPSRCAQGQLGLEGCHPGRPHGGCRRRTSVARLPDRTTKPVVSVELTPPPPPPPPPAESPPTAQAQKADQLSFQSKTASEDRANAEGRPKIDHGVDTAPCARKIRPCAIDRCKSDVVDAVPTKTLPGAASRRPAFCSWRPGRPAAPPARPARSAKSRHECSLRPERP